MSAVETDEGAAGPQPLLLDPFSFHPGMASRINGLGGNEPGHEPTYAFHTPYVEAAPGKAHFAVHFTGLTARRGTLSLRINMIANEPGARAQLANSMRIQLNRLVGMGGAIVIDFEGFRGFSFALLGFVPDETDAEATGLIVALDRPADPDAVDEVVTDARTSTYGRDTAKPVSVLVSVEPATLASPVSQAETRHQHREPAFMEWQRTLGSKGATDAEMWRYAYVMQVLRRYGVLQAGARGLGFGLAGSPLPAAVARHGVQVVSAEPDGDGGQAEGVERRTVDFNQLPRDLVSFDFVWADHASAALATLADAAQFSEAVLACLRPGGLAVLTMPLARDPDRADGDGRLTFTRADVERLALVLISRGHEVAQFKVDGLTSATAAQLGSSIGLVARRAPSVI